jgi:hypothetical protein
VDQKPHRSTKAPGLKAAVCIRRANGLPKRQIARELKIARNTVNSIIKEANLDQLMESGLAQGAQLIPESFRVLKHRLAMNSENAALAVLKPYVFDRIGKEGQASIDPHIDLAVSFLVNGMSESPKEADKPAIDMQSEPQAVIDNANKTVK